jgi:hypothetical protein
VIVVVNNLAYGPYRPGQEDLFKAQVIKAREAKDPALRHFRTEIEGTEPGFPDVLSVKDGLYLLIEFKVSDDRGVLHFEKTQPLFYKKHRDLNICIAAWDVPGLRLLMVDPDDVVAVKSLTFRCPKGPLSGVVCNLNRNLLSLAQ